MKKIVATLLFFIFANSFFAPVFSASNVVKQMSLNITDSAFDNLKSAAKFFKEKEFDSLCRVKKDADICKNGIPNTQNILNKSFSKDKKNDTEFQKKFFEVVVGFYNELNDYKISLNKINSETQSAVEVEQILVRKITEDLIKKLNEERKTLDDVNALFDERAKKYDELTDLNWNNVKAVTPDLQKYASDDFKKYRKDNKIEPHIEKTYAGLNDVEGLLKQKDDESLDDWLNRIGELKKSLQDEVKKTDTNIEVLKTIKVEREKENDTKLKSDLDDAWKKFMKALDDEKNAVKIFDNKLDDKNSYSSKKDKVSLKSMNDNLAKTKPVDVELHKVDDKNEISITDKKDIPALIKKLNEETERANNNADKLKKAKIAKLEEELQKERETEAGLINEIAGTNILISGKNEPEKILNDALVQQNLCPDCKNHKADKGNKDEDYIKNLEKEIKNVQLINDKLQSVKDTRADAFKNCQDELLNYVKPDQIKDLLPPIKNLSDCQDRLKLEKDRQEQEIQKIRNLFKDLIDRNSLIEDFERAIWAKDNVWLETKNNDLKEINKKYLPFGYNPETKSISCTDGNFGKNCPGDIKNIALKWDTVLEIESCLKNKSKACLNVIPTNQLSSWIRYIEMAIVRADDNIPVLKEYIEYKQQDCKNTLYWGTYVLSQSNTVPTLPGINKSNIKTTDKTTLVKEVEECKTQQTESKCQEFANVLNKKTTLKSLFEKVSLPSDVSENCVKNINEKVCSGYAKLSFGEKFSVANLGLTKSSNEMKEDYGSYLEECKNKVDAKVKADSIDAAKKKLDLQCLSGDEKAKNDMLVKFDNLAKTKSVDIVKDIIQKAIADECLKRSINAEVEKCNEKSGTPNMIKNYAIVNGKANYTSVEDVKNKCFETFKNKCSNKDYKWNLTYENMTSELKKCEDEAGPKKCNDHIAEVEKVLGVGAKVDTTGWTWLNKAPECYKQSDEKICADYQKDLKEKLNFTFVDIKDANNTVNVKNCKAMVDKVRNEMNAALNACPELKDKNISEFKNVNEIKDMCAKVKALNACPALKDRKVSEFKTVAEIEAECKKINIQNAIKICNDVATEKKLKGLLNGEYNDISKVNNDCLDKFKKECSSKDWDSFKLDLLNKNSVNELKKKYDDCSLRKMNAEKCATYESEQRIKYSETLAKIEGAPTDDLDRCKAFVDEKLCISYLDKKGATPTDELKKAKYSVDKCLSIANVKELANLKIKLQEEAADFVCKALKVMKYSESHTAQAGSNIYVEVVNTNVREDIGKYKTNFSYIGSSVNPSNFFCHIAKYCKLSRGSFPSLNGKCKNNGSWDKNPNSEGKHELTNGVKKVVRAEILRVYGDDPSGDICSNISRVSNGECN